MFCAIAFLVMKLFLINGVGPQSDGFSLLIVFGPMFFLAIMSMFSAIYTIFCHIYIYKDVLRDMKIVVHSDGDGGDTYSYYLYFDEIFGKYRKKIAVSKEEYEEAQIGKSYYIGVEHTNKNSYVYPADIYQLSPAAKEMLVTDIRKLGKLVNWKWQAPEDKPVRDDGGVKYISPEQIVKDMNRYKGQTVTTSMRAIWIMAAVLVFSLVIVALIIIMTTHDFGIMIKTIGPLTELYAVVIGFFLLIGWISNKAILDKKNSILRKRYKVVLEIVEKTEAHDENKFRYRDIHELKPVYLKSGHMLGLDRSMFNNVCQGDKLYVVYLGDYSDYSEENVVAVYQEKLGKLDFGFDVEWKS